MQLLPQVVADDPQNYYHCYYHVDFVNADHRL